MAVLQGSIQVWSQPAATWMGTNPVLLIGQYGHESDSVPASPKVKIGDGVTAWNALSYLGGISAVTWGSITGTLLNQTDLQAALDLKAPLANPLFSGLPASSGKTITFNKGGDQTSSNACGILVEQNGLNLGYFITTSDKFGWILRAPALVTGYAGLNQNLITGARQYEFPDNNGTFVTTGNLNNITSVGINLPLTGTPTAPTAAPGTNTTQLATTAFVTASITASGSGYIKSDGTIPLTAAWNAGAFAVTHNSVVIGSAANTIAGGAAGANLILTSNTSGTKTKILFGTSGYDELQDFVGFGTQFPSYQVHLQKNTNGQIYFISENISTGSNAIATIGAINNSAKCVLLGITGGNHSSGSALYQTPNRAWLECNGSGGLLVTSDVAATPIIFAIGGLSSSNEVLRIMSAGLGIGITNPLASLHIKAGTATANTAPIKLTAGTNLTTPENGAIEFDGTNIFITVGGVRKTFTIV